MYTILWSALKGWVYWKHIIKKFNPLSDDYQVMYLPAENGYLFDYLKKYLYSFMHQKNVRQVLILSEDEKLASLIKTYFSCNSNIEVFLLPKDKVSNILHLYRFGQFNPKFMYLSLNMYGRRLKSIIEKKSISEEEIFAGGLFTLNLKQPGYPFLRENWDFNIENYSSK